MDGVIARGVGSPCATLVLDAAHLPREQDALLRRLGRVRAELVAAGERQVLKLALIAPSAHPLFDLDYRFVQCLPDTSRGRGESVRFDTSGTCGHSLLASVVAARRLGWLTLTPGGRVRVAVSDNETVVCEVVRAGEDEAEFTVHFVPTGAGRLGGFLPTGEPVSELAVGARRHAVSLVSVANPYVFIDARALGVVSREQLFADDARLFATLAAIRASAARRLGLSAAGAFPKIAAIAQFDPGRLAVRALTIPGWHPTLALTGTVTLGVAGAIAGTIPCALARRAGCSAGELAIDTRGGAIAVTATATGDAHDEHLCWTSVAGKRAYVLRPISLCAERTAMRRRSAGALASRARVVVA